MDFTPADVIGNPRYRPEYYIEGADLMFHEWKYIHSKDKSALKRFIRKEGLR